VSQVGVPFFGDTALKLPSHLAKSRHGIFYFRLTFSDGRRLSEKRLSLRTRNPQEARMKAAYLSGIMAVRIQEHRREMAKDLLEEVEKQTKRGNELMMNLLQRCDRQHLAELSGLSLSQVDALFAAPAPAPASGIRKLDIEMPGGFKLSNINSDEDMHRALHIMQSLNLSDESMAKLLAGRNPTPVAPAPQPEAPKADEAGMTIQELVPRYAGRKRELAPKTLYEYGNYHRKFVEWLERRTKKKHIPIHSVTRQDIGDFIEDLLAEGLKPRTIKEKYLAAISGLFELALSLGAIPDDGRELVTRGHKVRTKRDARKSDDDESYIPFTADEIAKIFHPQFLHDAKRPTDFWCPLLGLFTAARLNELCQLDIKDIENHGGLWAIRFTNDAPDKSLKGPASKRLIPLHPTLIELGFLDYVKDASQFGDGRKVFPDLTFSIYHGYAATPSERWGEYLTKLGITHPLKVFHSFRSTSNNHLKHSGVDEETRCQFVGHQHDTVNSSIYSSPHTLPFLVNNVADKLVYPMVDFTPLKYTPGRFTEMLADLCAKKARMQAHRQAKAEREAKTQKDALKPPSRK